MPLKPTEPLAADIEELFQLAWEVSGEARARLLALRCGENVIFRRAVEELLAAAEEIEHSEAWNQPAIVAEAASTARQGIGMHPGVGATLDRYKLLERLGSGGMGVVWKATRADDAYSKLVAIKVIHGGLSDPTSLRRFMQERQILAGLEHPHIARLLDGGSTADGLPFLVMEYVDGVRIDEYLKGRTPDLARVLDLFRRICGAVSYAHRNLVVHRDLKPGNILVTADGEPKLLDFGIAKLLDGSEGTRTGDAAMTAEYASPEQICGGQITTASDTYSLGVLLHEMLTGRRPYRSEAGPLGLAQAIAVEVPQTLGRSAARYFDAELETIVQKALRKEPERRYGSVDEFSEDLRRYQGGYPVTARPDTRRYRARKFVRRHRGAVVATALAGVSLVAGSAAIWRQERIAERRFDDVRKLANSYLFEFHDAIKDLPGTTRARQLVVKRAVEFLDKLAAERAGNVDLGRELATGYDKIAEIQGSENAASLGDQRGALSYYQRALAIRQALHAVSPGNLELAQELSFSYSEVGWQLAYTGQLAAAGKDLREAVAISEGLVKARPADPRMREALANSYSTLADILGNSSNQNLGDFQGALALYRKSFAIRQKLSAEDPGSREKLALLSVSNSRLSQLLQTIDDKPGAVAASRRSADIQDELLRREEGNAELQRGAAVANRNLALLLLKTEALPEARERGDRAMGLFERVSGDDPGNIQARVQVADGYNAQGSIRAALDDNLGAGNFYRAAIGILEALAAAHPADPPRPGLRTAYNWLAELHLKTGDTAGAIHAAQRELAIDAVLLQADEKNAGAERNQGVALRQIGQAHEANGMVLSTARERRIGELRDARGWYEKSLAVLQKQKNKGTLIPLAASELEKLPGAIRRCGDALAVLAGA